MNFLGKWFSLIRAILAVARTMPDRPEPPRDSEYDFAGDRLLYDLMLDHRFEAMVEAICRSEIEHNIALLRTAVRDEKYAHARGHEAAALIFEELPQVFRRYSRLYEPTATGSKK